ncbi:hypothetical protein [Acidithiobacillus sp.]
MRSWNGAAACANSRADWRKGFYGTTLSLVDIVLTADLHLLRLLDGVTIPLDLLYYFQRVATVCGVSLEDGMTHHL